MAATDSQKETSRQQKGGQNSIVDFRGVDDPKWMDGSEQSGQRSDKQTIKCPAREQKIQRRGQGPETALDPAHQGMRVRAIRRNAFHKRQQPGIADGSMGGSLFAGSQRSEHHEA